MNMQTKSNFNFNNLPGEDQYLTLMRKNIPSMMPNEMITIWHIAESYISMIYRKTILRRGTNQEPSR